MNNRCWTYLLAAILALALSSTACGGEEEPQEEEEPGPSFECGEGTVLHDETCVAEDHDCDDDQVVTPLGECFEPTVFCGQGSHFDAATEECVSSADITCGEGTVEDGGECVLADPLRCGEGTVLAGDECVLAEEVCGTGTELDAPYCVPSEEVCTDRTELDVETGVCVDLGAFECGTGTVEHDDACIPSISAADQLAAEADIDYMDGESIVPAEDETFVFTGTLDTILSHTFSLEGTQGQWLEVTIYSRGLPSPGLHITDDSSSWERSVAAGTASMPSRVFPTPIDGSLDVTVTTSLATDDNASSFGDESWQYVGTVEVIDAPTAQAWDALEDTFEGALDDSMGNFVEIDIDDDLNELLVTPSELGVDAIDPVLEVWSTPNSFSSRHSLVAGEQVEVDTSNADTIYFHFDAVEFLGSRTDFQVSAAGTEYMEPGDIHQQEFEIEAGQTLFVSHRSEDADDITGRIRKDGEVLFERQHLLAENQFSYTANQTRREFFYVTEDGTYVVEFENTSSTAIANFVSTSTVEEIPVFEVPDAGETQFNASMQVEDLEPGDWRIVVIETPGAGVFDITITAEEGSPRGSVFNATGHEIVDAFGTGGVASMQFEAPSAGHYYAVSRPWSSFSTVNGSLDFDIQGQTVEVVEPGDVIVETFDVDTFDLLTGAITHISDADVTARLINPHGTVVFEESVVSPGLDLMELFPGPGQFTLEVENTSTEPVLGIHIDAQAATPLEIIDEDNTFSYSFDRDSLDAGTSEYVLLHTAADFLLDLTAFFEAGEEGGLRVWNQSERETIAEAQDEESVVLNAEIRAQQTYVVEFEAISDISDGYSFSVDGAEIVFVDVVEEHDPPLTIPTNDGQISSNLSVSDCPEISDVSITTDFPTGSSSSLYVDLYAPNQGGEAIALHAGTFGTVSTTYPDPTEPSESLDPLLGSSGDGVWSLEVLNTSVFSSASLASWSVHLTCTTE